MLVFWVSSHLQCYTDAYRLVRVSIEIASVQPGNDDKGAMVLKKRFSCRRVSGSDTQSEESSIVAAVTSVA